MFNSQLCISRSHERAQHQKLLSGYQVHLTPSLRPERQQMADIVKCSGGEPLNFDPQVSPGDKVLVVSCEEDLSMCRECYEAGVPVHSTELILGGVLKQQLDLKSYPVYKHDSCCFTLGIYPDSTPFRLQTEFQFTYG